MKNKPIKVEPVINHENWHQHKFEEEFTFSSNGKTIYMKRTFHNGQILYWAYDEKFYPLDEGSPSNARAYSAVNRIIYTKT